MAQNAHDVEYKMTSPGLLAHPNLIVPKAYGQNPKPDAKKSYSASFVLASDHPDTAPMKAAILKAAKSMWPGLDIAAEVKAGRLKVPFTSGDKLVEKRKGKVTAAGKTYDGKADYQLGKTVFKASTDFPPALGVRVKGQGDIDVTEDNKGLHKNAFYFGVSALGGFIFHPYDAIGDDGKPGVKAYLSMVHSLNTGARLAGTARSAADAFKGVAGAAVNEDPTAGSDDFGADGGDGEVF